MSGYENLLDASFKGVPFLVESEELTRFGRRIVNHEYPNTDEQYSEDVGGFPRDFNVSGFLVGEDVSDQLDALINACNEEDEGRLVLPFFGTTTVKCGEGNVSISPYVDAERVYFTATFYKSRDKAGFVDGLFDSASLPSMCDWGMGSLSGKFGSLFESGGDIFGNTVKKFDLKSVLNVVKSLTKFVPASELGGIIRMVDNISGDLDRLIGNGKLLAENLNNVFTTLYTGLLGQERTTVINSLLRESSNFKYTLPITKVDIEQNVAGFFPIYNWEETTEDRIDRNYQRNILIAYLRLMMLILAYSSLGTGSFDTEEQLDKTKTDIEKEYLDVMHGITGIEDGARLQGDTSGVSGLITDKDVWGDFQAIRIASLIAVDNDQVVNFKVDYGNIREFDGVSVLNAAYLSNAESIKTEDELLDMARVMYNINGREPYHLKGKIKILKRLN